MRNSIKKILKLIIKVEKIEMTPFYLSFVGGEMIYTNDASNFE